MLRKVGRVATKSVHYVTQPVQSEFGYGMLTAFGGMTYGYLGFIGALAVDYRSNEPIIIQEETVQQQNTFQKRFQRNLYKSTRFVGLYGGMTVGSGLIGAFLGPRPLIGIPFALIAGSAFVAAIN